MYSSAPVVVLCGFCCGLIHHPVHTYYSVCPLVHVHSYTDTESFLFINTEYIDWLICWLIDWLTDWLFYSIIENTFKRKCYTLCVFKNWKTGTEFVSEVERQQFISLFKVFCNQSTPVPLWVSHALHHTMHSLQAKSSTSSGLEQQQQRPVGLY